MRALNQEIFETWPERIRRFEENLQHEVEGKYDSITFIRKKQSSNFIKLLVTEEERQETRHKAIHQSAQANVEEESRHLI